DLDDRESGSPRADGLHDHSEKRAAAADAGGVWLARGRDDRLAVLLINALDDSDVLSSAGKEAAMTHLFDADDRGVILQHERHGMKVGNIVHGDANRCSLAGSKTQRARFKANSGSGNLRRGHGGTSPC